MRPAGEAQAPGQAGTDAGADARTDAGATVKLSAPRSRGPCTGRPASAMTAVRPPKASVTSPSLGPGVCETVTLSRDSHAQAT